MLENVLDLDRIAKINLGIIPVLNVISFGYLLFLKYSLLTAFLLVFSLAVLALSVNYWTMFVKALEVNRDRGKLTPSNVGNFTISIIKSTPIGAIFISYGILSILSIVFMILNISVISYVLLIVYLYLFFYMFTRFALHSSFYKFFK